MGNVLNVPGQGQGQPTPPPPPPPPSQPLTPSQFQATPVAVPSAIVATAAPTAPPTPMDAKVVVVSDPSAKTDATGKTDPSGKATPAKPSDKVLTPDEKKALDEQAAGLTQSNPDQELKIIEKWYRDIASSENPWKKSPKKTSDNKAAPSSADKKSESAAPESKKTLRDLDKNIELIDIDEKKKTKKSGKLKKKSDKKKSAKNPSGANPDAAARNKPRKPIIKRKVKV